MKRIFGILLLPVLAAGLDSRAVEPVIFTRHYAERGSYRDVPRPGEEARLLEFFAAPGEYEPVQLLIRSAEPVTRVSVAVTGDWRNGDAVIAKDSVEIRRVADQMHWLDPRRFERLPYLLLPSREFPLKPDETERIWLTVKVPEHAAPGVYESQLEVTVDGTAIRTIPLRLTVWPFELRNLPGDVMSYSIFYGTALPEWARNEAYLKRVLADMKAHGLNSFICHEPETPEPAFKVMREVDFAPEGGKFIWVGALNAWKERLEQVRDRARENGLDLLCYGIDEPNTEERYRLQREVSTRIRRDMPDAKIITAVFTGTLDQIADTLDVWMVEGIDLNDEVKRQADAAGKTLYTYECRLSPVDPLNSRHYWGLLAWRVGAQGVSAWYYGGSTIGQITDRYGNPVRSWTGYDPELQYRWEYVFCTPDGLYSSIGWEGVREGIDDVRYLYTLAFWIDRARAAGKNELADAGEQLLREIRDRIHPERYRRDFDAVYHSAEEGRNGEVGANFNRPAPELPPEECDRIRHGVARMTAEIVAALESPKP